MKKILSTFLLFTLLLVFCSSCTPKPDFDVRGTWDYTMFAENSEVYDIGTIIFDGQGASRDYTQINIYDVEYVGNYTVSASVITLTGYENWQGILTDANTMNGDWQHDDGSQGTFEATRK